MSGQQFDERDVEAILARAIEIDGGGRLLDRDQLRTIAAELQVSSAALDRAIAERAARSTSRPPPASDGIDPMLHAVGLAAIGSAAGAAGGADLLAGLTAPGLLTVVSLAEIVRHRDGRRPWTFQSSILVLWGSFVAGFAAVNDRLWDDAAVFAGGVAMFLSLFGMVVPRLRREWYPLPRPAEPAAPAGSTHASP